MQISLPPLFDQDAFIEREISLRAAARRAEQIICSTQRTEIISLQPALFRAAFSGQL